MLRAIAMLCAVFARVFFLLLLVTGSWISVAFKGQNSLFILMPRELDDLVWIFQVLLVCCFIAQLVHVIDLLYVQTQHDIFFIDWEQPRTTDPHEGGTKELPVSVWRTIFAANEW